MKKVYKYLVLNMFDYYVTSYRYKNKKDVAKTLKLSFEDVIQKVKGTGKELK